MLSRLDLRGVADLSGRLPRPVVDGAAPVEAVRSIIGEVRSRGDSALRELTLRFDGVDLADLRIEPARIEEARRSVGGVVREALEVAASRIEAYHRTQLRGEHRVEDGGASIRSFDVPVGRAGCYVPGGLAAYPSTVLMTAVPARVAGVPEVVVCVPPSRSTGRVAEVTLAAAAVAGVAEVYAVGGAQAIAALAYGTETIRAVDVICGPGNRYVAIAKREVAGVVGVAAAFAGPSEVVVIADHSAPPAFAAVDLLVQAEHGPDGLAWLITWEEEAAEGIVEAIGKLAAVAPRRAEIEATLASAGHLVLVDGPAQAIEVANLIAPEHLELIVEDAEALLPSVRNAGATFVGPWSPASLGDYAAGPSHVLPTHGTARFSSALTTDDFVKHHHVVSFDEEAFLALAPHVEALAVAEGLDAHAESIRVRRGA